MGELAVHRSRHRIAPFVLHQPGSVDEACALLAEHGANATIMAGGIDVISRLKQGAQTRSVIDVGKVGGLHGIEVVDGWLMIGAAATHRMIETSAVVQAALPMLAEYVSGLGNIRIRCQGTIGGNLLAGHPGYEALPMLQALDATLHFSSGVVQARAFRAGVATGLLTRIGVPLKTVAVTWDRGMRPLPSVLLALSGSPGHFTGGTAVIAGAHRRPFWAALPMVAAMSACQLREAAPEMAGAWAKAMPDAELPGLEAGYIRQLGTVLLRRLISGTVDG